MARRIKLSSITILVRIAPPYDMCILPISIHTTAETSKKSCTNVSKERDRIERDEGAARPTGTEDVYKLYAESFRGTDHLRRIQEEAQALIGKALSIGK